MRQRFADNFLILIDCGIRTTGASIGLRTIAKCELGKWSSAMKRMLAGATYEERNDKFGSIKCKKID